MAEAHFFVFLFKRFYLIYILNLSTCLFAFYNTIFSMFHYCFLFIYVLLLGVRRSNRQEGNHFDRFTLQVSQDVTS